LSRVRKCFSDYRNPIFIEHELGELLAQRIYGLALGYEDLNDHEELRRDPLLALLAGKRKVEEPLAGKSTLNRLELTPTGSPLDDRYHKITYSTKALDALLVDIFLESYAKAARQIVLDLDVTDTPLYGQQEDRFFHGYYNEYCYLPLYIFCGEHLLCARQRASNQDASAGCREEVERIVKQIRQRWAKVRIILRADSGFCREELMAWCEQNRVDYVFGLGAQLAATAQNRACDAGGKTGTPENGPSGARVCRVSLPHAKELEPLATCGGQSRVSGEG
jgi:Transposase DDE domain group 1